MDYVSTGKIRDAYVDELKSSGSYVFSKSGNVADWFSTNAHGIMGNMFYTKTDTGTNSAAWLFNDGIPSAGTYTIYAFIPNNYATSTKVPYTIYGGANGTTWKAAPVINQYSYYNYWVALGSIYFTAGEKAKVTASDTTGEGTGKYVGIDLVRRLLKSDGYLYQ